MRPQVIRDRLVGLCALVATGCAVFAPKAEYCMYREIAETQSVYRLVKLYSYYTAEYPDGVYSDEIEKMRPEIEREIFMNAGEDQYKLMTYVELFPDGIYTVLAQQKIAQIQYMEQMQAAQQAEMLAAQEAAKKAAEEERLRLLALYQNAITDWLAIALTKPYGLAVGQISASSPRFAEIWGSEPAPTCSQGVCTKHYTAETWYQVQGSTRTDRQYEMVLKLVFQEGKLLGFSLTFPGRGVLPLLEMQDGIAYEMDQENMDRAAALVYGLIAPSMPEGSETGMADALWAWTLPGAGIGFLRTGQLPGQVTDSLVVQLTPPPPPEPEGKAKKKKKKKGEELPPPPPVATLEQLLWSPPAPAPTDAPAPGTMEIPDDKPAPGTMEIPDTPET